MKPPFSFEAVSANPERLRIRDADDDALGFCYERDHAQFIVDALNKTVRLDEVGKIGYGDSVRYLQSLPHLAQSQRAVTDQILILRAVARKLGLYDAEDYLSQAWDKIRAAEAALTKSEYKLSLIARVMKDES